MPRMFKETNAPFLKVGIVLILLIKIQIKHKEGK